MFSAMRTRGSDPVLVVEALGVIVVRHAPSIRSGSPSSMPLREWHFFRAAMLAWTEEGSP